MDDKSSYIKTDNNTFINQQNIVWIKQMNDCLRVGTIETDYWFNTYKICKLNNPHSYNILYNKIKQTKNDKNKSEG